MLYVIGNYKHLDDFANVVQNNHPQVAVVRQWSEIDDLFKEGHETNNLRLFIAIVPNLTKEQQQELRKNDPFPALVGLTQDFDDLEPHEVYEQTNFKRHYDTMFEVLKLDPYAVDAVRLNFNPSQQQDVFDMKMLFARAIDLLCRSNLPPAEFMRSVEQIRLAQMRAVYALTGKRLEPEVKE